MPWIVLGLVSAGAYLYAGVPAALLVLLFGLPICHARTAITPNAAATQATISALSARHSVRGGPLMM